jgi:hypothetical protein
MTLLLALFAARAGTVTIDDDGFVRGQLALDVAPAEVRKALLDGEALAETSPDVRDAVATPAGPCQRMALEVKGLFSPFEVQTERCETADGWVERLVDSDVFTAWESTWTVSATPEGGTLLHYAVRTELDLPVPASMVRQRTARSVHRTLDHVAASLQD